MPVTPGEALTIVVGGVGGNGTNNDSTPGAGATAGAGGTPGGGGAGGEMDPTNPYDYNGGGGGGGYSGVFGGSSVASGVPLVIAAGGGGDGAAALGGDADTGAGGGAGGQGNSESGTSTTYVAGGAGGVTSAGTGCATGGTGGPGDAGGGPGANGTYLQGGAGGAANGSPTEVVGNSSGGGGGGGYCGGGGGGGDGSAAGGGGGSSYGAGPGLTNESTAETVETSPPYLVPTRAAVSITFLNGLCPGSSSGSSGECAFTGETTYPYDGGTFPFTVPNGVLSLDVVAVGARGGILFGGSAGALGASVEDPAVPVTPGQVLTAVVGGVGGESASSINCGCTDHSGKGGTPGGGGAGGSIGDYATYSQSAPGAGGGGYSGVLDPGGVPLVIAGGGGGSDGSAYGNGDIGSGGGQGGSNGTGGGGGGVTSAGTACATGGAGGPGTSGGGDGSDGGYLQGGVGGTIGSNSLGGSGGGGGGGYCGGGGGGGTVDSVSGGGGGSSYGVAPGLINEFNTSAAASVQIEFVGNAAAPVLSVTGGGSVRVGQQLTTTTGAWQSPDALSYGYQWQRCDSSGSGCIDVSDQAADPSDYSLTSADLGHVIQVLVTATDNGMRTFAASNQSAVVLNADGSPVATATALSASDNPAVTGQQVALTATVSPAPDGGTVAFTEDGVTIPGCGERAVGARSGTASCKASFADTGSHSIVASYSGDSSFSSSHSSALNETVTAPSSSAPTGTTTVLVSSARRAVTGQRVRFTATVSPSSADGTVSFLQNGKTIAGCGAVALSHGTASCASAYATAARWRMTAIYSGAGDSASGASASSASRSGTLIETIGWSLRLDRNRFSRRHSIKATLTCARGSGGCPTTATLSVTEILRHGKIVAIGPGPAHPRRHRAGRRVIVIGSTTARLAAGRTRTIMIHLNGHGHTLLAQHHRLHARASFTLHLLGRRGIAATRAVKIA